MLVNLQTIIGMAEKGGFCKKTLFMGSINIFIESSFKIFQLFTHGIHG